MNFCSFYSIWFWSLQTHCDELWSCPLDCLVLSRLIYCLSLQNEPVSSVLHSVN